MKISLIMPVAKFYSSDSESVPPYALLYVGSALKRAGHDVKVFHDSNFKKTISGVLASNPDIIGISAFTGYPVKLACDYAKEIKKVRPDIKIVLGGYHASMLPDQVLNDPWFDFAVIGEGEETMVELVKAIEENKGGFSYIDGLAWKFDGKIIINEKRMLSSDIDYDIDWSLVDLNKYTKKVAHLGGKRYFYIFSSRGCPYSCLKGDTLINTVEGMIPIKDLVGREKIGIYTYDRVTGEALISDAINIRKTGTKELVRVKFDDGTHIDCTSDHKFVCFKNGNQFVDIEEFDVKAVDLKYKQRVRAIKENVSGPNKPYINVSWKRKGRNLKSRMIIEYNIGRKLLSSEHIHHINGNTLDNRIENLKLCNSAKEHLGDYHPEISERMKLNNPAFNMNSKWVEKIRQSVTGLRRSDEHKEHYRLSKLGDKNPNYLNGRHSELTAFCDICGNRTSRGYHKCRQCYKDINHKVISVRKLKGKFDVYNMEVPKYEVYYANNVLVHNCSFCAGSFLYKQVYRKESAEHVIKQYREILDNHNVELVEYLDDNFFVDLEWAEKVAKGIGRPYRALIRLDRINDRVCDILNETRCRAIFVGIESGNEHVRNDIMGKRLSDRQIYDAISLMAKKCPDINIAAMFIGGIPGETYNDFRDTCKMAMKLTQNNPHVLPQFNVYAPYPYCKSYKDAIAAGWVPPSKTEDWILDSKPGKSVDAIWLKHYSKELMTKFRWTAVMFVLLRKDNGLSGLKRIAKDILRLCAMARLYLDFYWFPIELNLFWIRYMIMIKGDVI